MKISLLFYFLAVGCLLNSDSLWDPAFKGYLASARELIQGDIVLVEINSNDSLSFVALSSDNKKLSLEFSGGEVGNLFSFLPEIQATGNAKLQGEAEIQLSSSLVTVVRSIDEKGNAFLEGSRSIEIDGKGESLILTGMVSAGMVGPDKRIQFEHLANGRLRYQTFLTPLAATLTDEDIIRALAEISPVTTEEPVPTEPAPATVVAPAAIQPTPQPGAVKSNAGYTLAETTKKALLIQYINKLLDLIFQ